MKINIPEKYAELYLKALTDRKKQLLEKIEEFQKEIDEINNHIGGLTNIPIFQEDNFKSPIRWETDGYRKEWTWTRKIDYILHKEQKFCSAKYIVNLIMAKEIDEDKNKVRSSISAALSNRIRLGHGIKFEDPISGVILYGDLEWIDEKSQPKIEHLPEELKANILK